MVNSEEDVISTSELVRVYESEFPPIRVNTDASISFEAPPYETKFTPETVNSPLLTS